MTKSPLKIIQINQTGLDYAWDECQKLADGSATYHGKPWDGWFDRDGFNETLGGQDWNDPEIEGNGWESGLKDFQGRVHEVSFDESHFDVDEADDEDQM